MSTLSMYAPVSVPNIDRSGVKPALSRIPIVLPADPIRDNKVSSRGYQKYEEVLVMRVPSQNVQERYASIGQERAKERRVAPDDEKRDRGDQEQDPRPHAGYCISWGDSRLRSLPGMAEV